MGSRFKGKLPDAVFSPLATSVSPPRPVQVEVVLPVQASGLDDDRLVGMLNDKAADALEEALEDLRSIGASEEQIGAIFGAMRMVCLLRVIDEDLEGVVLEHLATGGRTPTLREVIAEVLMPELGPLL